MRDLKELIPIVINNIEHDNDFHGLCLTLIVLESELAINRDEFIFLKDIFKEQAIDIGIYDIFFWWPTHRKQPRIEFLNELLKTLKN